MNMKLKYFKRIEDNTICYCIAPEDFDTKPDDITISEDEFFNSPDDCGIINFCRINMRTK